MHINKRWASVACLAAVALAAGGAWLYQAKRFKHFAVHEPGMVYRSAFLSEGALRELIEKHQIRSMVNLCEPTELTPEMWEGERRAAERAAVKLHTIPLPNSVEINEAAWAPHLAMMNDPDNYPMLVHCQHGVTRTAMFLAAYDVIHRHKSAEESIASQPMFGHDGRATVHVRAFAKNFDRFYQEHRPQLSASKLDVLR